ncbi:MAG: DUF1588 domain-containing protein [Lentisphaeraceae bacterium]|nr:DUF1588 domain-containing protein [Lentisphaeraceae bacterium]
MSWRKLGRMIAVATAFSLLCRIAAKEKTYMKDFVNKYCIDCHGAKKKKASVSFAEAEFDIQKHASVYFWQDSLDVLNSGEMPPEDELQPSSEELKNVIGEITDKLQFARRKLEATGGVISMRHLSRREYVGSIKDLFGSEIPTDALPPDASAGFDTNGSDQFFTSNHYESYFSIAQQIVESAIQNATQKAKVTTQRHDPEDYFNDLKTSQLNNLKTKMALLQKGASYKEAGFGDETQAKLFKKRYKRNTGRLEEYFKRPYVKVGSSYPVRYAQEARPGSLYKVSVELQSAKEAFMPVSVNHQEITPIMLKARKGKNQTYEFICETNLFANKLEITMKSPPGSGYIDNLKITGPYKLKESFFERTFKKVLVNPSVTDNEVQKALMKFASRAFRYQNVNQEYILKLLEIYNMDRKSGLSIQQALKDPIAAIISAPDFLYLKEKNDGKRQKLTQHEFAIRLAYFLWSSPPDLELYKKVKNKTLFNKNVLVNQVSRMLASDKSDAFLASFINQWSHIKKFDEIDLPRQFQGQFQDSARRELSEFFKVIARENLPLDNLIDSDFVVIDNTLANFYKIKGQLQGFQKVKVPEGNPRGGVLSQAAFLIMGTTAQRTSPTLRGVVIRERFLHDPPPPPPPNVPQIEADDKNPQSVRMQVKKHKEVPQCASCHEKIDPIGFGLESFDYLGRWRTIEVLGKVEEDPRRRKKIKVQPKKIAVDASGFLSESEKFNDFEGLKKALMNRKNSLAQSIYESMLSYGIGRDIEFVDDEEVKRVLAKLQKDNYRVRDMITAVITSKIFMTK